MENTLMISLICLWISVLVLFIAIISLYKRFKKVEKFFLKMIENNQSILPRHDAGVPKGNLFPVKEIITLTDESIDIQNTNSEGIIILFSSATCDICEMVYPGLEVFSKKTLRFNYLYLRWGLQRLI